MSFSMAMLGTGLLPRLAFAQSAPLKIGVITTLSGPGGYTGQDIRDGLMLAADLEGGSLGGAPVQFMVEDDGLKPAQAKEIAELINNKSDYVTEADTQLAMTLREFLFPDIPPGQLVSAKAVGKKLGRHAVGEPVTSGDQTLILRGARKRRRCLFGRFWMEMANSQKAHSQCVRGAASASYHLLASRKLYPPIRPNALDSRNRRLTVPTRERPHGYPHGVALARRTERGYRRGASSRSDIGALHNRLLLAPSL